MASTKQPKIVGYMAALYDFMSNGANELDGGTDTSDAKLLIWQGRLIETCNSVGIPTGYYKKVVDALRRIGCIDIVSRGTRGANLTVIILRHPPTPEAYEDAIVKSGWEGLTSAASLDTLSTRVKNLESRIGGVDWLSVFKNLEDRLQRIETALGLNQEQDQ